MKSGPMVENNTWTKSYYIHHRRLIPCLTLDPPVRMISQPYKSMVMTLNLNLLYNFDYYNVSQVRLRTTHGDNEGEASIAF